ncbi:hypothetical protein GCM10008015_16560 [Flavobacterium palustre]|uniref:3-keto-alpha-glucoside-1,2-lyase/3-keto-2-hydroxy-glucal hydratase domain-containing protein n=1 Tax=Flavobacterium palustre TaxID=1476463 RepID=A0ABQ1HHH0_9FLAO|nr:DUF1080 domain-containing protein [Flavobacterium palustre]GGA76622.1 hypothetical protein GCM10008015_16560 [Flavobacterium palustre]
MNTIYRLLLVTLFFVSQNNQAQKRIALFNQKDLKGWYAFGEEKGKTNNADELFSVENNMIRMFGPKAGYLMSEQSFRNFELTVEYRWNTDVNVVRKNNNKNSGVMYLVPAETPDILWPKGIQFQIKEGATGDFVFLQETTLNINGTKTTPGKSVVSKRFADAEKPIGEWNQLVIISKNGVITQKLNGKTVNQGTESSVTEGRILLQYEGFPIDFRKVNIKKSK